MPYADVDGTLERWISWPRRCRIPSFGRLQKGIVKQVALNRGEDPGLGLIESTNTKIRLITGRSPSLSR